MAHNWADLSADKKVYQRVVQKDVKRVAWRV